MTKAASTMQSSQQHTTQGVSMAAKILNVDEAKLVRAAGGIIRRNGTRGAVRVAIVHPPGYDGRAFPKGKIARRGVAGGAGACEGGGESRAPLQVGAAA